MIAKEKTCPAPTDKLGRAGYDAEMQMAFYLRRAFADSTDVFVYNDLRLERNGEFAQIDHLAFHRFGFVIVESKSVVSQISVNVKGEFTRTFGGYTRGIPSPIRQAQLQADLLRKLLNDHKERLRRRVLFGLQQGEFGELRFRKLVAVSDHGIIARRDCDPPELCKAEQITDEIQRIIERHERAAGISGYLGSLFGSKEVAQENDKNQLPAYTDEEMSSINTFLLERHSPVGSRQPTVSSEPNFPPLTVPPLVVNARPSAATTTPVSPIRLNCRHCESFDVTALHGRFGYYLKCNSCQGNTPIDQHCDHCRAKARIQKSGPNFTRVCDACGTKKLIYENVPMLE